MEKQTTQYVTFPLVRKRFMTLLRSVPFLFFGALCLLVTWLVRAEGDSIAAQLFYGVPGLVLLTVGLRPLPLCLIRVHFVPQGVALTVFGKTLRQFPVRRMQTFCVTARKEKNTQYRLIISGHTVEQLTQLRERELKEGLFSRHDYHFRKRNAHWPQVFAREYLEKRTKGLYTGILRRDLMAFDTPAEFLQTFTQMYPMTKLDFLTPQEHPQYSFSAGIEALEKKKIPYAQIIGWKDPDPTQILRDLEPVEKEKNWPRDSLIILLVMALFPGVGIVGMLLQHDVGEWLLFLVLSPIWIMIFGWGWLLGLWGSERLSLLPEGIRGGKGRRSFFFPAEQIRTVIHTTGVLRGQLGGSLVVTDQTPEELWQAEQARLQRRVFGKIMLRYWQTDPQWKERLAIRRCLRIASGFAIRVKGFEAFFFTPERAAHIKKCYPQAVWLEDDFFGKYE